MKRNALARLAWAILALIPTGCASTAQLHAVVVRRAAYDMQCEAGSLEVTDLPGAAYGVRGCGQQATYVLSGTSCQNTKQLTKREVRIYCTPVLDHTAERTSPEKPEPEVTAPSTPVPQDTEPPAESPPVEATPAESTDLPAEGPTSPPDGSTPVE